MFQRLIGAPVNLFPETLFVWLAQENEWAQTGEPACKMILVAPGGIQPRGRAIKKSRLRVRQATILSGRAMTFSQHRPPRQKAMRKVVAKFAALSRDGDAAVVKPGSTLAALELGARGATRPTTRAGENAP